MVLPSDQVRQSCFSFFETGRHIVDIDFSGIPELVKNTFTYDMINSLREDMKAALISPFTFDTIAQEVNFTVLSALLAFGSGFRQELHETVGKGAADTMLYGVISLYLENNSLNADFLKNLRVQQIADIFGLPRYEQVEISPAIYQAMPSKVVPLVDMIHKVIVTAGTELQNHGFVDFYDFFEKKSAQFRHAIQTRMATLNSQADNHKTHGNDKREKNEDENNVTATSPIPLSCQYILQELISTFSGFQDAAKTVVPPPTSEEYAKFYKDSYELDNATDDGNTDISTGIDIDTNNDGENHEIETFHEEIFIYKKAQLLISMLYRKFAQKCSNLFHYFDINSLTIFSDNVIPAMLTKLGFIKPCIRIEKAVDSGAAISASSAYALRAAAIAITEVLLCYCNLYLQTQSKESLEQELNNLAINPDKEQNHVLNLLEDSLAPPITLTATTKPKSMEEILSTLLSLRASENVVDMTYYISPYELDYYFYTLGKSSPELRKLQRHVYKTESY